MPLPAIAIAAARAAAIAGRGAAKKASQRAAAVARRRAARFRKGLKQRALAAAPGRGHARPYVFSPEGLIMLLYTTLVEIVIAIVGIFDIVVIGIAVGIVINVIAYLTIGAWLWFRVGGNPFKRVAFPLLNFIPFAKFFPFWLISVGFSLDKGGAPSQEEMEEPQEKPAEPQRAYAP